ncbi:hypothetical protein COLO4_35559 [Corchorus olitorius]|uniref:Ty3 transposon capsid-like protein domain-containing protein n=1 Tax=Corchorus olitorius TaxID=93759 RepID=A0A1R3GFI9_9ROSI|nr:hypothetical protein COLO4_35559 [Corchorus olitorius]
MAGPSFSPWHTGNPYLYYPKTYKMDLPKFSGENFRGWYLKLEQYFEAERVPEHLKARVTLLALEDDALAWHQFYINSQGGLDAVTWDMYLAALKDCFASEEFSNPFMDLVQLKQTGTIKAFHYEFMKLLALVKNIDGSQALSIFLANLKPDITQQILLHRPATINHALNCHFHLLKTFITYVASHKKLINLLTTTNKNTPGIGTKANRRPTPAEIEERKRKRAVLFEFEPLVEDSEQIQIIEETTDSQEHAIISMHAIYGTSGYQTMRMNCTIKNQALIVLVDTGSTHNFINSAILKSTGLLVDTSSKIEVSVADGNTVITSGSCEQVQWKFTQAKQTHKLSKLYDCKQCSSALYLVVG